MDPISLRYRLENRLIATDDNDRGKSESTRLEKESEEPPTTLKRQMSVDVEELTYAYIP